MSREIKRVALGWDWPLKKVWEGYLLPRELHEVECYNCSGTGYSPRGKYLYDMWYGYVPFQPADNGSTPFTPDTPAAREIAERNVSKSPEYYGRGEAAIVREATRLATMFNEHWSHHLNEQDVAALLEADLRLRDFTHTWSKGTGWVKNDPPTVPTAQEVNEWSLRGFGHDSISAYVCVKARCEREGVEPFCATCGGHGTVEKYPGQREAAEAWQRTDPPAGDGWQFWETVSEGSPLSPVFATSEELVGWLVADQGYRESAARQLVADGYSIGSFVLASTGDGSKVLLDAARDADVLATGRKEDHGDS